MKKTIRLTESELKNLIMGSVKRVMNETDYHRAYKYAKSGNIITPSDSYTNNDVLDCLQELQDKLRQAKERARIGGYDEGEAMNWLHGAIKGLEAFIQSNNFPSYYQFS